MPNFRSVSDEGDVVNKGGLKYHDNPCAFQTIPNSFYFKKLPVTWTIVNTLRLTLSVGYTNARTTLVDDGRVPFSVRFLRMGIPQKCSGFDNSKFFYKRV